MIEAAKKPYAVARVDDLERSGRVRALALRLSLDTPLFTSPVVSGELQPVYLFRRIGVSHDFCTCDESRYHELSRLHNLFEVKKLLATPAPLTNALGEKE